MPFTLRALHLGSYTNTNASFVVGTVLLPAPLHVCCRQLAAAVARTANFSCLPGSLRCRFAPLLKSTLFTTPPPPKKTPPQLQSPKHHRLLPQGDLQLTLLCAIGILTSQLCYSDRMAPSASPKLFSLEGKGLKLTTAEDLEPHIAELRSMGDVEEVRLLGNTLGVGACKLLGEVLATKKNLQVCYCVNGGLRRMATDPMHRLRTSPISSPAVS